MIAQNDLNVDSVAKIGLMYLDGDSFEEVLLDRFGDTDYDFAKFTEVKNSLTRMEKINPGLRLCTVLWQLHPDNPRLAVPVVAGRSLPLEGWRRTAINEQLEGVFSTGQMHVKQNTASGTTHYYYPVKNSDDEIVGVLELIEGMAEIEDL